jgi:thiamine biosynthesis lipoprotein
MRSPSPRIERARPLLGTTVSIRVHGLIPADAHRAIDEAFGEIALVHRLMSFQQSDSEVSRLNREACERTQDVHPATFEVLHWAREIAEASEGCFDITVAGKLVEWRILPAPLSRHRPDPRADWRDIELGDYSVRFRRPLWIDVSGIAKGYAVDRAIETLQRHGATQVCVNAGGDLKICGPEAEAVALRHEKPIPEGIPFLEIENAAVASSSGHIERRNHVGEIVGPHVDGRDGGAVPTDRFASVVADSCLIADALTKPVLILQETSSALLRRFGASAHLYDASRGWRHLPGAEE